MTNALPILMFHDISTSPSIISISPETFRNGLEKLHRNDYRAFDLADVAQKLKNGDQLKDNRFVITFDDGYASIYEQAFPVLKEFGMTATVFLIADNGKKGIPGCKIPDFGRRKMLEWQHVMEMDRHGISFGGHTLSHPDLTRIDPRRAEDEIVLSKTILEEKLGSRIESFAYPYGYYNDSVREIVKKNYPCACSDKLGYVKPDSDPWALERIDTYYLRTNRLFNMMSSPLFPLYIEIRGILRTIRHFCGR